MAWPKGRSRKPVEDATPETDGATVPPASVSEPKKATGKRKWTMKAGNDWENVQFASDVPDELHVPADLIPEGMTLQWCTESVWGQELPARMATFTRAGWVPVHPSDFDGRFDGRWSAKGSDDYIKKGGLVLCAMPESIANKIKDKQRRDAKQALEMKEAAFTGGDIKATGADHPSARAFNRISRSIERLDVPKE